MSVFEEQIVSHRGLIEIGRRNFRAWLEAHGPHPAGYVTMCLEHPPWVVYTFGDQPRRGTILGVSHGPAGFTAEIAVLHKYNVYPPLMFERRVAGIELDMLVPHSVDVTVLEEWAAVPV